MNKNNYLSASTYHEQTIQIPHRRLAVMLQPGDVIRGWCYRVRMSATDIEYRVTAVHHWGVMAVLTTKAIAAIGKTHSKEHMTKNNHFRGHIKFKWCHISGAIFRDVG